MGPISQNLTGLWMLFIGTTFNMNKTRYFWIWWLNWKTGCLIFAESACLVSSFSRHFKTNGKMVLVWRPQVLAPAKKKNGKEASKVLSGMDDDVENDPLTSWLTEKDKNRSDAMWWKLTMKTLRQLATGFKSSDVELFAEHSMFYFIWTGFLPQFQSWSFKVKLLSLLGLRHHMELVDIPVCLPSAIWMHCYDFVCVWFAYACVPINPLAKSIFTR